MKKLRLDLAAVQVESFPTSTLPGAGAGTVRGQAGEPVSHGAGLDGCTVGGCSGDGACSWDAGCSVDNCSDVCTGYPGCSGDGNCSRDPGCTGLAVCYWTP
ncbi:MAG TPA: hypothetical protein VLK84_01625 [Longimicrobium sp.]|nr:hypothetical protein [Longimicrobium sp.]